MNNLYLGVDTSNYTTSLSLVDDNGVLLNIRKILNVKESERGLRQSDALFLHTKQLPELCEKLFSQNEYSMENLRAVGVSSRPRNAEKSYMPCFLAGISFAKAVSGAMNIPLYCFSHQEGHIEAAARSCGNPEIFKDRFISFHVSGGTTEVVLCHRSDCGIETEIVGGTSDLNAGQAIDRCGVMLGMKFPCGKELESFALLSEKDFSKQKVCVKDTFCSLSGLENMTLKMFDDGFKKEDIAKFLFTYIAKTLGVMIQNLRLLYPSLPILLAGGVMSNVLIRNILKTHENIYFASAELSTDNACGIGFLAGEKYKKEKSCKI